MVKQKILSIGHLIRVHHWVKNLVVFLPVFFAGIFLSNAVFDVLGVFITFCLASSLVYVFNDLMDAKSDKVHPIKKNRPIPSGLISKFEAVVILIVFSVGTFLLIWQIDFAASVYVLAYLVLNLAYTLLLKHISIIDVSCIGIGFVLRVIAGGVIAGVFVSHWMIIMTFLLSVSIAFAKRKSDLILMSGSSENETHKGYSLEFIDVASGLSFSITLVAYVLYSISDSVIERIGSDKLYITSLFVFLGIMRYLQLSIVEKNTASPVKLFLSDRFLQFTIISWQILFIFIIYG